MGRAVVLTAVAMVAFAANSLLARLGVRDGLIDAGSFSALRLISGAVGLWLLVTWRSGRLQAVAGSTTGAVALFVYAAAFSFAYLNVSAAMGALMLFGAVQLTMVAVGLWQGESVSGAQWLGLSAAMAGLVALLLPGLSAPPVGSASLMLLSGVAWGIYSVLGRGVSDPLLSTTGNFIRAVPLAVGLLLVSLPAASVSALGVTYAVLSGVVASGAGYAIWYTVLPALSSPVAAAVQLSVPVITAIGGVLLLAEDVSLRLVVASFAVLGGIAIVILAPLFSARAKK